MEMGTEMLVGMGWEKNNVMGTGLAFSLYILFSVLCM